MYGLTENMKYNFEGYQIEMTKSEFSKTDSGKSWRSKADSIEKSIIDFENYYNIIDAIPFFKNLGGTEKVTKGYTVVGYIPTTLISTSPNKLTKVIREFRITSK